MRLKIICIILIFNVSVFVNTKADSNIVRLFGNNKDYAGYNLVFKQYDNYIISETSILTKLQINDDGSFDLSFPLYKPVYSFVDLGKYKAFIYLEPNVNYNLVLPPLNPKSEAEKFNPHFQPEEILLGIANEEARTLNRNITEFDALFDFYYNEFAVELFIHGNIEKAEEIEMLLEERFVFDHPVFKRHKELSYMKLWHMTVRRRDRQLVNQYLSNREVEYHLPIYWEVFSTVFKGFIPEQLAKEVQNPLLGNMVRQSDFNSLVDILRQDSLFIYREFAEVLLLYSLYEAWHEKNLPEKTILAILSDASESASTKETKLMAEQYHHKLAALRPGTAAPNFKLIDQKGEYRSIDQFKDKFIYLNFMHTGNYSCMKDLQSLKRLHQVFSEHLHIVTIMLDEDYDTMLSFLKRHPDYTWEFLHFEADSEVLLNYNVIALPSYYLINPDGVFTLSPAPSPDENFHEIFIPIIRSRLLKEQKSKS